MSPIETILYWNVASFVRKRNNGLTKQSNALLPIKWSKQTKVEKLNLMIQWHHKWSWKSPRVQETNHLGSFWSEIRRWRRRRRRRHRRRRHRNAFNAERFSRHSMSSKSIHFHLEIVHPSTLQQQISKTRFSHPRQNINGPAYVYLLSSGAETHFWSRLTSETIPQYMYWSRLSFETEIFFKESLGTHLD